MLKPNIRTKLIISFLLVGLLPILFFGYLSTETLKSDLEAEAQNSIGRIASDKAQALELYLDAQAARTDDFASDNFIREAMLNISRGDGGESSAALSDYLLRVKKPLSPAIAGIFVTDVNGTIVSATSPLEIGKDESGEAYLAGVGNSLTTSAFDDPKGHFGIRQGLFVGAPLIDYSSGEQIGVLVNVFSNEGLQDVLSGDYPPAAGVNQTLAVYLVDNEKRMMVMPESSFHSDIEGMVVGTPPVEECLAEGAHASGTYENFAAKEVIGASRCLPGLGVVLIAEAEVDEALRPLKSSYSLLAFATLFFSLTIILFGLVLSSSITRPIEELTETIDEISMGRLAAQLPPGLKDLDDEIGKLARAFDRIIISLKLAMKETSPALRRQKDRAESALHESEERYRTIFEVAPVVIFTLSSEGKLTSLNPSFERITGWEIKEVIGKDFITLVHPDDAPKAMEEFRSVLSGSEARPSLSRVLTKSGRYVVAEIIARPLIKDGQALGVIGVAHDLGQRMLTDEVRRNLALLIETSAEAVISVDNRRMITGWNPGAERLYGYGAREAIGKSISIIIPPGKMEEHMRLIAMAGRGERMEGLQTVRIGKGGKRIKVLLTVFPILDDDGNVLGAASISRPMEGRPGKGAARK